MEKTRQQVAVKVAIDVEAVSQSTERGHSLAPRWMLPTRKVLTARSLRAFAQRESTWTGIGFLARLNRTFGGCHAPKSACWSASLSSVTGRAALEIADIGVAQTVRGTGVAHALVKRAVDAVRTVRAVILTLAVDRRNLLALRFY